MKILVVISGASGVIYGKKLVEKLKENKINTKVIVTEAAKKVAHYEKVELPESDYEEKDIAASPASGTSAPDVMIVAPCSAKTLGQIANGIGDTLVTRAAEVALKERKKLILVTRETPLSYIMIKNMETVTLAGGIILPACPGFYHNPKSIDELVEHIIVKILNLVNVEHKIGIKWGE
ncbi:UbiX family flavin prenyltransferase [Candidatus Micrarchaeota archaeon]|nr:UbiX family flavin prenyltransferase [Candidatus Micrarchaeota archaeon]